LLKFYLPASLLVNLVKTRHSVLNPGYSSLSSSAKSVLRFAVAEKSAVSPPSPFLQNLRKYLILRLPPLRKPNQEGLAQELYPSMQISRRPRMKRKLAGAGLIAVFLCIPSWVWGGEEKLEVSAGLGVFNRYVFRGYEIGRDSVVFQPSLGAAYMGFSASFWGNIDSHEKSTQNFVPDRPGQKSFNETDLTLSYTHSFGKLELTAGYIYYATKYTAETEEFYLGAGYDTWFKPTLTVYRDITSYPGTYISLSLSQSWKLYRETTLDVGASAAYFAGDSGYWKTFEASTGGYTGGKYRAFHDGRLSAGVSIPLTKNFIVQPLVQYSFPLSSEAKRQIDGRSYNPNGYIENVWIFGVNLKFSN
jgi:hypothetical protein